MVFKGRYEVKEVIGRGGMGCVYKAADRVNRVKIVAIKELMIDKSMSREKRGEVVDQFQTEARILARLSHPNLPKVYDYWSLGDRHYIVMEFIPGKTLEEMLNRQGGRPLDERMVLSWAVQILRAMHFLSVQRPRPIVFRDLKPSNIMITKQGRVKLIDFGIARFFKQDKSEDTYVYGTPGYAAPEQYGTGQTDVRSDIFSLGATLYHCLTGRNPSENPLDFPDPRRLNPYLSRASADIIMKALEPDREKRFQTALEMKHAVQRLLLEKTEGRRRFKGIIQARPDRDIKLPFWKKTCWVALPAMSLGCSGYTGILSTDELWIQPRPRTFGPDTTRLVFRVESGMLRPGRRYTPAITIKTPDGPIRPRVVFRRELPWFLILNIAAAILILFLAAFSSVL